MARQELVMHQRMINLNDLVPSVDYPNTHVGLIEKILIFLVKPTDIEQHVTSKRAIRSDQRAKFERMGKTIKV
ncbi:hypothetical protein WT97_19770 [Burkholderia sp. MSMB1459WGS]|nr:hypothetical protein WT97_19770 [Burkholderia sp. MSMB1459WGS]